MMTKFPVKILGKGANLLVDDLGGDGGLVVKLDQALLYDRHGSTAKGLQRRTPRNGWEQTLQELVMETVQTWTRWTRLP